MQVGYERPLAGLGEKESGRILRTILEREFDFSRKYKVVDEGAVREIYERFRDHVRVYERENSAPGMFETLVGKYNRLNLFYGGDPGSASVQMIREGRLNRLLSPVKGFENLADRGANISWSRELVVVGASMWDKFRVGVRTRGMASKRVLDLSEFYLGLGASNEALRFATQNFEDMAIAEYFALRGRYLGYVYLEDHWWSDALDRNTRKFGENSGTALDTTYQEKYQFGTVLESVFPTLALAWHCLKLEGIQEGHQGLVDVAYRDTIHEADNLVARGYELFEGGEYEWPRVFSRLE